MNPNSLRAETIASLLKAQPEQPPYTYFPVELLNGQPRPAAVLLPLLQQEGEWHILFIRRTEVDGDYHSGQVALPGGAKDPEDPDNIAAALRETNEELGIQPDDIQILGTLNDFITISNYRVTPVVATISWPLSLTPAEDEVARVFTIPLNWLLTTGNHETSHRQLPNGLGNASVIYFKRYDGELLWGATARFIMEFFDVLGLDWQ
jgi:8-oxo-dGTP pyrophosphatase MutT (NUDIX family)